MKKNMILNHLIDLYLKENTPVSSGVLKEKCKLPFSPSTIRNYFQKLDSEGLLLKVHISSGSVPSKEALKQYWYEHFTSRPLFFLISSKSP
jgi:heat-inducible transcriptional repressor